MPKRAPEMSALAVRRLDSEGVHAVGGVAGLLLRIQSNGSRSWVLRTTIAGRRRDMGLGSFPEVSLSRAREKAAALKDQIREGLDPIAERRSAQSALRAAAAKSVTFDEVARRYMLAKGDEFSNDKHRRQWSTTLQTYASPILGALPVDRIELAHVVQALDGIWRSKTETATRVRGRIEKVLDFAIVSGFREPPNPAMWKGNLDAVLPAPGKLKTVKHHKALPYTQMPEFMAALRSREAMTARALELLILTAARSGEVRGATWDEIDLDGAVWRIPGERMKAGRPHAVPLSADAVRLLKGLPGRDGLVFPAQRTTMLTDMAISALLKRMGWEATPHGMRSTFRDWIAERTSYPWEVAEQALAHTIPSATERAYRRGDLFAKRARLMEEWAAYCSNGEPAGDVVGIREAR